MNDKWKGVIFTPDDEPYLGRELLTAFDELISCCLKHNHEVAFRSRALKTLSPLQDAACVLIPQGISLALSIRELIRQGYLLGARVLMRPLVERAVTMMYLHREESALEIWTRGWRFNERPSLGVMLQSFLTLSDSPIPSKQITAELNSVTHGDPQSAFHNLIPLEDGVGFASSKILCRPDLCDGICAEAIPWMSALVGMMGAAFPEADKVQLVQ